MHAHDVRRAAARPGDLVDIERRGIGGENRAGLSQPSELREQALFYAHVFECAFNDEIGRARLSEFEAAHDLRQARVALLGPHAAALHEAPIGGLDVGPTALQGRLCHFDERHGNARIGERHGDAAAHGTGADDGDCLDLAGARVPGKIRNFGHFAFGREQMAHCGSFVRAAHDHEKAAFLGEPLIEAAAGRGLNGVDGRGGGRKSFGILHCLGAALRKRKSFGHLHAFGAQAAVRRTAGHEAPRIGQRPFEQVALDQFVDDADLPGLRGADGITGQYEIGRRLQADEARQTLRAPAAGEQTQFDFRKADLCRR